MFGLQKKSEDEDSSPIIVDRLPDTFVHDPTNFAILLGEQIDRFWPASGLNFLFDDDGRVNGFFDGTFLYLFQVNQGIESYSVATCVMEGAETPEAEARKLERIRQTVTEHTDEFDLNNDITLEWTSQHELILKHEGLPVSNIQVDNVDDFEASMEVFMDSAHKILKTIKRAEKKAKKEEKSRRKSSKKFQTTAKLTGGAEENKKLRGLKSLRCLFSRPSRHTLDESGATEHYSSFQESIDMTAAPDSSEPLRAKAA